MDHAKMNEAFEILGHKFAIGSIVSMVGSATQTMGRSYSERQQMRGVVVEQAAHRCHGGVQRMYILRLVDPNGGSTDKYTKFNEVELQQSEPFGRSEKDLD